MLWPLNIVCFPPLKYYAKIIISVGLNKKKAEMQEKMQENCEAAKEKKMVKNGRIGCKRKCKSSRGFSCKNSCVK